MSAEQLPGFFFKSKAESPTKAVSVANFTPFSIEEVTGSVQELHTCIISEEARKCLGSGRRKLTHAPPTGRASCEEEGRSVDDHLQQKEENKASISTILPLLTFTLNKSLLGCYERALSITKHRRGRKHLRDQDKGVTPMPPG